MADLSGKWCLVTGAGAGIGRATVLQLEAQGARLILCDRRQDSVDQLAREICARGGEALSYGVDVAELPQMERFYEWVTDRIGVVDVLINNAGILRTGGLVETSWDDWRALLDVNLWGVIHATKLFVTPMLERGAGAVVNVASASGVVGFSKLTAYSTSKFALVGFSDALRADVGPSGVKVSVVCPGFVRTEMAKNSGLSTAEQGVIAQVLKRRGIPPEAVARAIVRAATSGAPLIHIGKDARVLSWLARVLPGRASALLAKFAARY